MAFQVILELLAFLEPPFPLRLHVTIRCLQFTDDGGQLLDRRFKFATGHSIRFLYLIIEGSPRNTCDTSHSSVSTFPTRSNAWSIALLSVSGKAVSWI